jgi:hypothetical protein
MVEFEDEAEEYYRMIIFEQNLIKIKAHNLDTTQTHKMGVNQFTIYTEEEFRLRFLGDIIMAGNGERQTIEPVSADSNVAIDWEGRGKVTAVRSQGQ